MSCLQHRFVANPNLQRWVYCELCGLGKEITAEPKSRPTAAPRRTRKAQNPPTQLPLNLQTAPDEEAAKLEAQAVRIMRDMGYNMGENVQESVERVREQQNVPAEDYQTEIATSTEFA